MATDWTQDADTEVALLMDDTSGNLVDESPNGVDLAPTGSPGNYNSTGVFGGAFDFTQTNNAGFSNASIPALTVHSACAWIAPDDDGQTDAGVLDAGCIISRNDGNGWAFGLAASNDIRYAHSWDGSGFSRWSTTADVIPYNGSFTHVAFTYDGSSTSNDPVIYINGVSESVTEVTAPFGAAESGGTFLLGIDNGSVNEFDGDIDDLLYIGQILTGTDVNEIMDSGIDGTHGLSLEQEGYRFRADDNNEASATWLAAQDTNVSRSTNTNTRLRVLINATGDPAAKTFQLEYRKVGSTEWHKVITEL